MESDGRWRGDFVLVSFQFGGFTAEHNSAKFISSVLFTALQMSSAAYDPIVRTVVQLSIVCLFFGGIYAFILATMFGKMDKSPEGIIWMRVWRHSPVRSTGTADNHDQNAKRSPTNTFWNPWIMLSIPLAWIIW
jgi:hypothetical protein